MVKGRCAGKKEGLHLVQRPASCQPGLFEFGLRDWRVLCAVSCCIIHLRSGHQSCQWGAVAQLPVALCGLQVLGTDMDNMWTTMVLGVKTCRRLRALMPYKVQ